MCPECGEWQGHPFEGNLLLYKEKMTGSASGSLSFSPLNSEKYPWWQQALGFLSGAFVVGMLYGLIKYLFLN